jgi:hypothetical protein
MSELERIFPECCSDTLLVELILRRKSPMHFHGISAVTKNMVNYHNSSIFTIGVVDTDKFKRDKDNPNIQEFSETVEDRIANEGLLIIKIPSTNKHLIRIHPRFEPWFWAMASKCGVIPSVSEYGFSSFDDFFNASKRNNASEDKGFKKFINAVVINKPAPIQTLSYWLNKVYE